MEYRTLPRGGHSIGVIGMGSAVIGQQPYDEMVSTIRGAVERGVNMFDMAGGHAAVFGAYGEALKDVRDKIYLQVHFGAVYTSGEYGWTTDLEKIKQSFEWQLKLLQTDYVDFGFIHCIDEDKDLQTYINNGVLDYITDLKAKGVVRQIGFSSHTPAVVHKVLDMGLVDILMFSINPLYDFGQGEYDRGLWGKGENAERHEMYCRCQREGVGITVMKPFSGGQLLDAKRSPFGHALTQAQCIQYALDKPGVVSVLPGYGCRKEMEEVLSFFDKTPEERDYSILSTLAPKQNMGRCVYCRHCHPCPAGLDIALINKYYDLARLGDGLAREHYLTLDKKAGDCISCGHCDSRCPFHVEQSRRMGEIREYFGE
ncbi:MAG: aldo/keto reductase [Clostridia bacterium]|nr:aldo/keto reductase [Clostridia bacterium]